MKMVDEKKKWVYSPTKFSDGPSGVLTRLGAKDVTYKRNSSDSIYLLLNEMFQLICQNWGAEEVAGAIEVDVTFWDSLEGMAGLLKESEQKSYLNIEIF